MSKPPDDGSVSFPETTNTLLFDLHERINGLFNQVELVVGKNCDVVEINPLKDASNIDEINQSISNACSHIYAITDFIKVNIYEKLGISKKES
jgi:hypothetical protein